VHAHISGRPDCECVHTLVTSAYLCRTRRGMLVSTRANAQHMEALEELRCVNGFRACSRRQERKLRASNRQEVRGHLEGGCSNESRWRAYARPRFQCVPIPPSLPPSPLGAEVQNEGRQDTGTGGDAWGAAVAQGSRRWGVEGKNVRGSVVGGLKEDVGLAGEGEGRARGREGAREGCGDIGLQADIELVFFSGRGREGAVFGTHGDCKASASGGGSVGGVGLEGRGFKAIWDELHLRKGAGRCTRMGAWCVPK
jgi:hypothetical protein